MKEPAHGRHSYITDLDPFCALALASTASHLQAAYLRDFMYRHLNFRSFLGVQIPVGIGSECQIVSRVK
jgi:hypothetical protein